MCIYIYIYNDIERQISACRTGIRERPQCKRRDRNANATGRSVFNASGVLSLLGPSPRTRMAKGGQGDRVEGIEDGRVYYVSVPYTHTRLYAVRGTVLDELQAFRETADALIIIHARQ